MTAKLPDKRKIIKIVIAILCIVGLGMGICSWMTQSFNFALGSILSFFMSSILFALNNYRERFLFLVFLICFFTFLIARPFVGFCEGSEWWSISDQADENVWFALTLVFLGLISLYIGAVWASSFKIKNGHLRRGANEKLSLFEVKKEFIKNIQAVSLFMFSITVIFYFIQQLEPVLVIASKGYLAYYSDFQSGFPWYFHTMASFMKYSLCIYLATLPEKRRAFIPLALFELSAVPALIIGVRNPIMLNSLFIFLYYLLRDIIQDKKKWIGRIEKIIIFVSTPMLLIVMAEYAYIRMGRVAGKNPVSLLIQFFYGQGVTFDALEIAYGYRQGIRDLGPKQYTFGGIIDYIVHGTLGQKLWGTEALPLGNGEINGKLSNSFAHNFSYVSMNQDYISGRGRGSSYLLENYFDFGYIGVVVFGIILGAVLIYMVQWFGKRILSNTIILIILTNIFFMPRAEATGCLTFIVTVQFWLSIIVCYLGSYFVGKSRILTRLLEKLFLYPKH